MSAFLLLYWHKYSWLINIYKGLFAVIHQRNCGFITPPTTTTEWLPKALILRINADRDMLQQGKKLGSFLERALLGGINQWRDPAALGQYLVAQIGPYSLNNDDPEQAVIFHLFICATRIIKSLKCVNVWVCVTGNTSRLKGCEMFDIVRHQNSKLKLGFSTHVLLTLTLIYQWF